MLDIATVCPRVIGHTTAMPVKKSATAAGFPAGLDSPALPFT
jgi:hypothetical protein